MSSATKPASYAPHPLPTTFSDATFTYTQLARSRCCAIYHQQHTHSGISRYDVIDVRVWDGKECYPTADEWGQFGWTFPTLPEAEVQFRKLLSRPKPKGARKPGYSQQTRQKA
jgi:hypothetical protein